MLWIYVLVVAALGVLVLLGAYVAPSAVLGFHPTATFDAAWLVMTLGMLLTLPAKSGLRPLSRARPV
jgi:hypothetical protein